MEKNLTSTEQQTKNAIIDKREYQLYRESKKTIYIVLISLITFMILAIFFLIFNQEIERKIHKNKPIQNKPDTVFVVKPPIQKINKIDNTIIFVFNNSKIKNKKHYIKSDTIIVKQYMNNISDTIQTKLFIK